MNKYILNIIVLFFISNIIQAQINKAEIVGKWKLFKREYPKESSLYGKTFMADKVMNYTADKMNWELGGMELKYTDYIINDSMLNAGSMKFIIERLYNDTLIVKYLGGAITNGASYNYKDFFYKVSPNNK